MKNGAPINWKSQKQTVVALSTCEAEYISMASAAQEAVFWMQFTKDFENIVPIQINCDNQSAITVVKN